MKSLDVRQRGLLTEGKTPQMTLIHFWAAYDAESRVENQQWSQLFSATPSDRIAYRGISLDPDQDVYERTLTLDQVGKETQQCVRTEMRSECLRVMGLQQRLHSYLVDERGVIRAVDPTPQELANYL